MASRNPVCLVFHNASLTVELDGDSITADLNQLLTGVIEAEVTNNNYYCADTFRVVVALADAPPGFDVDYLSSQMNIAIEIVMGPNPQDLRSLIQGRVDDFDYDPAENTVELRGRDYTGFFIDTKTTESWVKKTASEVATTLALRHGLDASLVTPTEGLLGAPANGAQTKLGDGRTEWDLLTSLAGQTVDAEGNSFVVYVTGTSLYFGPRPAVSDYFFECKPPAAQAQGFSVRPAADPAKGPAWGGINLRFTRNISLLRNVTVQMSSAQLGSQQGALMARYPVQPQTDGAPEQLYQFKAPVNMTADWLARQAQARQQDIARHELRVSFTLPGDNVLQQSSLLAVSGLGNVFDQRYFVQSVTRRFSLDGGYTMEGSAQNRNEVVGVN